MIFDEESFPLTSPTDTNVQLNMPISSWRLPCEFAPQTSNALDQLQVVPQNNTMVTTTSNEWSSSSSPTTSSHESISDGLLDHHPSNIDHVVTRSKVGMIKLNPRYALVSQKAILKEPTLVKEALQDKG